MGLCGISSRFQLLSPTLRQIAHALLTRSPLSSVSFLRRFIPPNSVRLACVRRAASVRPEPGSNSLLNPSISTALAVNLSSHQTLCVLHYLCTLIFYWGWASSSQKNLLDSFTSFCSFSLFNFQGPVYLFRDSLFIISHTFQFEKTCKKNKKVVDKLKSVWYNK